MPSSYDQMQGFKPAENGAAWAKHFRQSFPDAQENGVIVIPGGKTVQIKIGHIDANANMLNPDAVILLEQNAKGKWQATSFFMKENYFASGGPTGRLLDLETIIGQDKSIELSMGQLIDSKASGKSFHESVAAADNMGHISGFIESVEAGRIKPHVVTVSGVSVSGYPTPLDKSLSLAKS